MNTVSVLMPVYNAQKFIEDAIRSVLEQTFGEFDFYIINDASNDNSKKIIEKYSAIDPRIKFIDLKENKGMAYALNLGLKISNSEWIVRMDADDIMLPNRIERQLDFLKNNSGVKVASCRAYYIDLNNRILGKTANHLKNIQDFNELINKNEVIGLLHPGVIMHRETVLFYGGYRGKFWPAEDIDLWTRLSENGCQILIQDEILMYYRIHPDSAVTSDFFNTRLQYEWVRACKRARMENKAEPSKEVFLNEWNSLGRLKLLNNYRKMYSKKNYREAGFYLISHKYLKGIINLLKAIVLQPEYVLRRLINQLLK
jgi:glycosyltransferase involved in cell wall biosynthesis